VQQRFSQTNAAFLRLPQIIGNPHADPPIPPLIPIGRSTWWQWVRERKAPAPIKLAPRTTAWRAADIHAFIESLNAGEANKTGGE
jgi:prophage regulatory protein